MSNFQDTSDELLFLGRDSGVQTSAEERPVQESSAPMISVLKLPESRVSPIEVEAKFTLFPSLPLELRLKVWRSAFPGPREVNLAKALCIPYYQTSMTSREQPPPITFRINQESRAETLKYYRVLHHSNKTHLRHHQPRVFNPAIDLMTLPILFDRDMVSRLQVLGTELQGGLEAIRVLEIRDVHGSRWDTTAIDCDVKKIVGLLSGLQRLVVTGFNLDVAWSLEDLHQIENIWKIWFVEMMQLNPSLKTPQIAAFDYTQLDIWYH